MKGAPKSSVTCWKKWPACPSRSCLLNERRQRVEDTAALIFLVSGFAAACSGGAGEIAKTHVLHVVARFSTSTPSFAPGPLSPVTSGQVILRVPSVSEGQIRQTLDVTYRENARSWIRYCDTIPSSQLRALQTGYIRRNKSVT